MARARNVISKPDPAKLGEWDGWTALGYEPDAGKYAAAIKPPKMPNGPDGKPIAHDAALLDSFVKLAHGQKLPPALAQNIFQGLTDTVNERLQGLAAAGVKASADLKEALTKEWGLDYDANTEIARRAARALGIGADDSAELEKLVGAPRLLKIMHALGKKGLEGTLVAGDGSGKAAMSPATAEAELRRLEGDPAWMKVFTNPSHPQNQDYKAQHLALCEQAAKKGK